VELKGSLKLSVKLLPEELIVGAGVVIEGPWVSTVELFDVTSWEAKAGASTPFES
jgi:hypothetical protein